MQLKRMALKLSPRQRLWTKKISSTSAWRTWLH